MKKNFHWILLSILSIFLFVENVAADTSVEHKIGIDYGNDLNQIEIKGYNYLPVSTGNYDETTHFKISTSSTGNKIIYCSDARSGYPGLTSGIVEWDRNCIAFSGNKGKSLAYVYENGYNTYKTDYQETEYLTGDYYKDYFITQVAAWYFTIPADWMENNFDPNTGKYLGESNEVTQKISKLIKDAEAAATEGPKLNIGISNTTMTLTNDKKYYISDAITLNSKYLNSAITATVSGVNGAFVTTSKDATSGTTSFSSGSTVYIKAPVDSISSSSSKVTLSISGTSAISEGKVIQCDFSSDETYDIQAVIDYNPSNISLSDSISVTASKLPVKISKEEITGGKELAGAKLSIKSGGTTLYDWTSTTSTYTVYLEPGTYTLEETVAPEGYIKKTSKIEFTLNSAGKVYVDGKEVTEVVMTNEPIIVTISKKDVTGSEELAGATLRITDEEGNIAKDIEGNELEWISTTEPKKIHLAAGTYILEETVAPDGYIKKTSKIEFIVDNDGKVLVDGNEVEEVIMTNELITVLISKRSITGTNELPGAKLRITDKDGNVAKDTEGKLLEWTSSTEPKKIHLAAGTYILSETIAPEGYELSETVIEFTVTEGGRVLINGKEVAGNVIIFENTPEPDPVPTGSAIVYVTIALGVAALGLVIYLIMKKYKK